VKNNFFWLAKKLVEAGNHGPLARRVSGALDVVESCSNASTALAVLGKRVQIEGVAVYGERSILKSPYG